MYKINFYKGSYRERQENANQDEVVLYIEQHLNASTNKKANYAIAITGYNASDESKLIGEEYVSNCVKEFNDLNLKVGGKNGIVVGGYNGRGNGNVYFTNMPAILIEPLFCSTPEHAEMIRSEKGQSRLAKVLVKTIIDFYPDGGLIGFSVGHKYKNSSNDRGAELIGGGNEADYAEKILIKAQIFFEILNKKEIERENEINAKNEK